MVGRTTRASRAKETSSLHDPVLTRLEPQQSSSPPASLAPLKRGGRKRKSVKEEELDFTSNREKATSPKTSRKRIKTQPKKEEDINELPHNLGTALADIPEASPTKKPKNIRKPKAKNGVKNDGVRSPAAMSITKSGSTPKKGKAASYGLTPGQTPYPNWIHPTPEECQEVTRLLSSIHGEVQAPKTIPLPSLTVSGCGEVPSVLDALIRTRLSAATSGTNSSRAFAGLVSKFGVLKEGVGKGSVDWDAVRRADVKEIFEAIKSGGLADVKSKDIKKILEMVYEENQARSAALKSEKGPAGAAHEEADEKNLEVARAEGNVISLDHLHLLSNDDAFNALTKYPGIGPKTASCVLLFCLQRPSFAVDTHVFRLCKWLGWVPPPGDPAGLAPGAKGPFTGPNRNSTYAHCEVRVPDELKYPLHQLLIRHGKTCPRCRAITGESSAGWEEGCVIDHLVQRTGGRKDVIASPTREKKNPRASIGRRARKTKKAVESDEESSEMSDLPSDGEESDFDSA